jgi:nucleotide-binding universal stress UspA family protein
MNYASRQEPTGELAADSVERIAFGGGAVDYGATSYSAAVEAETVMLEGNDPSQRVASMVVKDAQHWDADLIVLGTHGRRGLDRIFLGSVAETLVRMAPTPVLLVRAKPALNDHAIRVRLTAADNAARAVEYVIAHTYALGTADREYAV